MCCSAQSHSEIEHKLRFSSSVAWQTSCRDVAFEKFWPCTFSGVKKMINLRKLSTLFAMVAFATLVGCAGTATRESTGEYIDDSVITGRVKVALVEDPVVKATEVNVETFRGRVQLSGFVSNLQARDRAVQIARGIPGVTAVRNDMRIK